MKIITINESKKDLSFNSYAALEDLQEILLNEKKKIVHRYIENIIYNKVYPHKTNTTYFL